MKKIVLPKLFDVLNEGTNRKVCSAIGFIIEVILVLLFVVEMSTLFYIFH